MLHHHEVVPYLLRRELIGPERVVEGDVIVQEASRRNRNFKVISRGGPCYMLKQGVDRQRTVTVGHEAAVYRHFRAEADSLQAYLPAFYEFDEAESVLVLELLRDAQNLREHYMQRGRFSTAVAAEMGTMLGALHGLKDAGPESPLDSLPLAHQLPWVLSVHRPGIGLLREVSGASLKLIRIVQHSAELRAMLDRLRDDWRPAAFIHRDIKADNFILAPGAAGRRPRVKLIDWELGGMGDPCWDVGSVFSDFLSVWLFSIPITGEEPPDRFVELSRRPLEKMQPAIGAFWDAYVRRAGLDEDEAERTLLKAVAYGAARLIQTGYEEMQWASILTGNIVCLLQLSLNIMQRPHEAIAHLLGIQNRRLTPA